MNGVRTQRWLAALLISVQAAAVGALSETVVFPVSASVAALCGVFWRRPIHLTEASQSKLYISLIALFFFKWMFAPHSFRPEMVFPAPVITQFAYAASQCLIVTQTIQLYLASRNERLTLVLPGFAAVALVCAFDIRVTPQQRLICQLLTLAFIGLTAAYFSACRSAFKTARSGRRAAYFGSTFLVLGVASAIGWMASSALFKNERAIEELLALLLQSDSDRSSIGFSGQARLGSVVAHKGSRSEAVALRIHAETEPGYLRGRVFDRFERGQWLAGPVQTRLQALAGPTQGPLPHAKGAAVFGLAAMGSEDRMTLECWPDASLAGNLFTPLRTTHIGVEAVNVSVDGYGIFSTVDMPEAHPYTAYVPRSHVKRSLPDSLKTPYLVVPPTVNEIAGAIAADVFANCRTSAEKVAAVERYFHENYEYRFGMRVPGREDPLNWFLREKPPAHCEFFASGAAVLLRQAGVPSRYVTGFVAAEYNSYAGHWIARNRDAHAWVEAWDEENEGWVTVEATPDTGVPTPTELSTFQQVREAAAAKLHFLRVHLEQGGLRWVGDMLWKLLVKSPLLVALVVLASLWLLIHRLRARRKSKPFRDPQLESLHRLLEAMDAHLRRLNYLRAPGETLNQFAARIRSGGVVPWADALAAWYERYAENRYARRDDVAAVEELQRGLKGFKSGTHIRPQVV